MKFEKIPQHWQVTDRGGEDVGEIHWSEYHRQYVLSETEVILTANELRLIASFLDEANKNER